MLKDRLQELIEPALHALGYELVLLEFSAGLRTGTLRLFIDKPEGVNLIDCEAASREVAALLDVEDPIQKAYTLEVSSPGLDRPLTKPEHFQRYVGETVKLTPNIPIGKRKHLQGRLLGWEAEQVLVNVDGEIFRLSLADIDRARLVPNFSKAAAPKGGRKQSS